MCVTFESVPIRAVLEVRFEYRLKYQFQRPLDYTISDRWYSQGAPLAIAFRYVYFPIRQWPVCPVQEFLPYPFQKSFSAINLNVFKPLSIDARRSIVGLCQPIGFFKDFLLADMAVQSPKPPVLVGLRLPVYLPL
jgi:hypothetical protein